jgi:glutamate formiminotransferase
MRLLCVPNWSFGRDRRLLGEMRDRLEAGGLRVHFCESDLDHNRTVTAFSGEPEDVLGAVLDLCELALPSIDLNRHVGVHPRIGALDVCPFVPLPSWDGAPSDAELGRIVDRLGTELASRFDLPVFLYEKSERGRHESDLPSFRKGGFGGLFGRELRPDFGPASAHPRLGVTVTGVRDFLIGFNVNLKPIERAAARSVACRIRDLRREGDPRFLGVRTMGLSLATRGLCQVSVNSTLPDLAKIDPIVDFVIVEASKQGLVYAGSELIGVIRERDLPSATHLPVRPEQIVDGEPDDVKL